MNVRVYTQRIDHCGACPHLCTAQHRNAMCALLSIEIPDQSAPPPENCPLPKAEN